MKPTDHYKQCCCPECRPSPAPPKRLVVNLDRFQDHLEEKHLKPITDMLNDTRAELRALRQELGLDPGPDVRLTVKTVDGGREFG